MKQIKPLALLLLLPISAAQGALYLTEYDDSYTLDNGLIQLTLSKDGDAVSLYKDGVNMVDNLSGVSTDPNKHRSFYLDYHTGISGGATNFYPSSVNILRNDNKQIHIQFIGSSDDHILLEYHYIMKPDVSGIYSYVVADNVKDETTQIAELRTVYRFDSELMPHLHNGRILATPPSYATLEASTKIQDETWLLDNGEIYSKYDLADYQRETNIWGVLGSGFGAWVISAGTDYFSGGALNQELLVHQDGIALNYLTGAHLGSPDMFAPADWHKVYGPWLLYINHHENDSTLIDDARLQAEKEIKQWPYKWVTDERYPIKRGQLKGQVSSDAPLMINLANDAESSFDRQTLGYYYSARTDAKGHYDIDNIIPGQYELTAYALTGSEPGVLYSHPVTIGHNTTKLSFEIPRNELETIWNIGQANRRGDEFYLANKPRNYIWHTESPADLTYIIGQSQPDKDWYFVQSTPGTWRVEFTLSKVTDSLLNVAIAAASNFGMGADSTKPELAIRVNGSLLTVLNYENDKAVYRSAMQSGRYHNEKLDIPAHMLIDGENNIELEVLGGAFIYDTINLQQ
ncbi:polysaccharide lyase family protein [Photobacterium satsumensis]|uniref:polysaccharide lyase family protein n=1 Tax=Photobacterium satsumensis TaxID=2910239 RepID=UPI003D101C6E